MDTGPTLVLLYGPPAVGKLTVARALAELTGFRVLHNHLLADEAATILAWGTPRYWATVRELRCSVLRAAAADGVDVVLTYVFAPADEPVVEEFCAIFEQAGGRVCCVQLRAGREELARRVTDASRHEFGKPSDPDALGEILARYHLFHTLPGRPSLVLDTEQLSARQAAERIAEELRGG